MGVIPTKVSVKQFGTRFSTCSLHHPYIIHRFRLRFSLEHTAQNTACETHIADLPLAVKLPYDLDGFDQLSFPCGKLIFLKLKQ